MNDYVERVKDSDPRRTPLDATDLNRAIKDFSSAKGGGTSGLVPGAICIHENMGIYRFEGFLSSREIPILARVTPVLSNGVLGRHIITVSVEKLRVIYVPPKSPVAEVEPMEPGSLVRAENPFAAIVKELPPGSVITIRIETPSEPR